MKKKKASVILAISAMLLFTPSIGCGQRATELMTIHNPVDETPFEPENALINIQSEKIPLSGLLDIPTAPIPEERHTHTS